MVSRIFYAWPASRDAFQTPLLSSGLNGPLIRFVFGAPRSGTTWMGKLIDSHPAVAYLHEPIHKGDGLLLHQALRKLATGDQLDRDFVLEVSHDLVAQHVRFSQPPFFAKSFHRLPYLAAAGWACERLGRQTSRPLAWLIRHDRVGMSLVKDGISPRWQSLVLSLGARALVMLRHPCAVVSSMLRGQRIGAMGVSPRESFWGSESEALQALGYRPDDIMALQEDELHALRWLVSNRRVLEWSASESFKLVEYGRLVRHTEDVVDEIFPWIGLSIERQTRDFLQGKSRFTSDWLRTLLGPKKMYYSVNRRSSRPDVAWRQELPPDSIRRILHIVKPFPCGRFWPDCLE